MKIFKGNPPKHGENRITGAAKRRDTGFVDHRL
jgi:hypothetical protein